MTNKRPIIIVGLTLITVGLFLKGVVFKPDFHYTGTIEATTVNVSARVLSVIADIPVIEGQKVSANATLLTFACEDYKLAAELAQSIYNRATTLYNSGSLSKENYDQIENRYQDTQLKLSWCQVKAPLSGTVLTNYHEVGELIAPGTPLFTLADLNAVYAIIYVAQPDIAKLNLNQKVNGTLPEMPDHSFTGTITHIADEAEFTPKNVQTREERQRLVYAVKVTFDNKTMILKPGMTIEIKV